LQSAYLVSLPVFSLIKTNQGLRKAAKVLRFGPSHGIVSPGQTNQGLRKAAKVLRFGPSHGIVSPGQTNQGLRTAAIALRSDPASGPPSGTPTPALIAPGDSLPSLWVLWVKKGRNYQIPHCSTSRPSSPRPNSRPSFAAFARALPSGSPAFHTLGHL